MFLDRYNKIEWEGTSQMALCHRCPVYNSITGDKYGCQNTTTAIVIMFLLGKQQQVLTKSYLLRIHNTIDSQNLNFNLSMDK